jgi:hypothetical protein
VRYPCASCPTGKAVKRGSNCLACYRRIHSHGRRLCPTCSRKTKVRDGVCGICRKKTYRYGYNCQKCGKKKPSRGELCQPCRDQAIKARPSAYAASTGQFAKPYKCRQCGKPIMLPMLCYQCSTGKPRRIIPEWEKDMVAA